MDLEIKEIKTGSRDETFETGRKLASLLKAGDIVALYGELGCGKTVLAKGICRGLDVDGIVTSPTFTLIQEYTGRLPVFHFDFYRLSSIDEVEMLDLDTYFNAGGISVIEWAERGEKLFPAPFIKITIDRDPEFQKNPECRKLKMICPAGRKLDQLFL